MSHPYRILTAVDNQLILDALRLYIHVSVCEDTIEGARNEKTAREILEAFESGRAPEVPRSILRDALHLLRERYDINVKTATRNLELLEDLERRIL